MLRSSYVIFIFVLTLIVSCSSQKVSTPTSDPYLWLEEIESPRSLEFAKAENQKTLSTLQFDPSYKQMESELRTMAYAEDRIPWAYPMNGMYYNFWRDQKNARGLWRRTTLSEYKKDKPKWEIIINLDELSNAEKEKKYIKTASKT